MIQKSAFIAVLVLALMLMACSNGNKKTQVIGEGESLLIPTGEISGTAMFHSIRIDGVLMEVISVKAPDGTNRIAYNTCQVCNGSPLAYFIQKGTVLECQNCKNKFPMERVGIEVGGCNPIPVFGEENKDIIRITYATLKKATPLFTTWKN